MSSTENNTNVLQSRSSKPQMWMNYLWEVTHQQIHTSQYENVQGQSASRDPESKRKELAECQKYLGADGVGAGPSCEDFIRAGMLEAVKADFTPLEVTVTVLSASFFLRGEEGVPIGQDSKHSWLPRHILLLPDLLLTGSGHMPQAPEIHIWMYLNERESHLNACNLFSQ